MNKDCISTPKDKTDPFVFETPPNPPKVGLLGGIIFDRLSYSSLLFMFFLLFSCSRDHVDPVGGEIAPGEIQVRFLEMKSLFGVIVKEYQVEFDFTDEAVDSVEVLVIEEGTEFKYGSVKLLDNKGIIDNLKIPAFIELLYVDFMDKSGIKVRERVEIVLDAV